MQSESQIAVAQASTKGRTVLLAAAFLGFLIWRWVGYTRSVELHPGDEFVYLESGLRLWRGEALPRFSWAPTYSAALALLHGALPADVLCFDVMNLVCRVAVGFTCWWALAPLLPSPLALVVAAWTTLLDAIAWDTGPGMMTSGNVYAFALACCAIVTGFWLRGRYRLATLAAIVLVTVRGDYAVWTLALAVCAWPLQFRGSPAKGAALVALALALVALATLTPSSRSRSWLTFQQHYARQAMEARLLAKHGGIEKMTMPEILDAHAAIVRAYDQPDALVAEDFPGATSVLQAAAADPARFAGYVAHNFAGAPAGFRTVAGPILATGANWANAFAVMALVGVGVALVRARSGSGVHRRFVPVLFACIASTAPALVLTGLRADLSLPLSLASGSAAMIAFDALRARLAARWRRLGSPLVAAAALLVVAVASVPRPYARAGLEPMPLRDSLVLLRDVAPTAGQGILAARNVRYPLAVLRRGVDYPLVDCALFAAATPANAAALLRQHGVAMVVWDPKLEFELRNAPAVRSELQGAGWRVQGQHGGSVAYVRAATADGDTTK